VPETVVSANVSPPDAVATPSSEAILLRRPERRPGELLARLQVPEADALAAVLLLQLPALLVGEALKAVARARPDEDRPRHRHVGADAGQRRQDLLLGPVEAVREGTDDDDERDAEPEAERRQHRAALAPPELGEHVADVDHVVSFASGNGTEETPRTCERPKTNLRDF
jgi:hypothetical protein